VLFCGSGDGEWDKKHLKDIRVNSRNNVVIFLTVSESRLQPIFCLCHGKSMLKHELRRLEPLATLEMMVNFLDNFSLTKHPARVVRKRIPAGCG
jgi:hypothetical protein